MDLEEAYKILEVSTGAKLDDIKRAHKDLIAIWHPDKYMRNPRLKEKSLEKTKEVNEAYNTIVKDFASNTKHNSYHSAHKSEGCPVNEANKGYAKSSSEKSEPDGGKKPGVNNNNNFKSYANTNFARGSHFSIRSLSSLTYVLKNMLWVLLGINCLNLFINVYLLAKRLDSVKVNITTLELVVSLACFVAFIITLVVFLKWVYQANKNCHGFGAFKMKFSPGWSVGYFFIPILSFYKPYQAMQEIWKASTNSANWQQEKGNFIVGWWWALWLISGVASWVHFRLSGRTDTINGFIGATSVGMFEDLIDILLCYISITLISEVYRKQEEIIG